MGTDEHGLIEIQSKWWSAQGRWWVRSARGVEVSLLTGVVPKSKGRENEPFGKGFNPALAGIFTLMRRERRAPGTWATRRHVDCYQIRAGVLDCSGPSLVKPAGWLAVVRKAVSRYACPAPYTHLHITISVVVIWWSRQPHARSIKRRNPKPRLSAPGWPSRLRPR